MGIKESALALADELEAFEDGDCEECSLYGQPECKGHLSCAEIIARYSARKVREAVERDGEGATTVSSYDLLSDDDRKALAWVREHGGLDMAASRFESGEIAADMLWGKGHGRFWTADEFEEEISKRLMPKGMEWPKYTDGSHVEIGDEVVGPDYGERINIDAVKFRANGFILYDKNGFDKWYENDDVFKRPPVLAADGEPLEVGQTVWDVGNGVEFTVIGLPNPGEYQAVKLRLDDGAFTGLDPNLLTHQRPVLDADGVLCREGDEVWEVRSHRRREIVGTHYRDHETGEPLILCDGDDAVPIPATCVTHAKPEPPDSWERIDEDAGKNPFDYCNDVGHRLDTCVNAERAKSRDLVRRCRALAERGE